MTNIERMYQNLTASDMSNIILKGIFISIILPAMGIFFYQLTIILLELLSHYAKN